MSQGTEPLTDLLQKFNCPLCGSTEAHVTVVHRASGLYRTPFFECAGCSVMFRDVLRFMRLVRRDRDPGDGRCWRWFEEPQRVLDEERRGPSISDALRMKPGNE